MSQDKEEALEWREPCLKEPQFATTAILRTKSIKIFGNPSWRQLSICLIVSYTPDYVGEHWKHDTYCAHAMCTTFHGTGLRKSGNPLRIQPHSSVMPQLVSSMVGVMVISFIRILQCWYKIVIWCPPKGNVSATLLSCHLFAGYAHT